MRNGTMGFRDKVGVIAKKSRLQIGTSLRRSTSAFWRFGWRLGVQELKEAAT
jgi:hypothetical protein